MGLLDNDIDILLRDCPMEPVRVQYNGRETHGDFVNVDADETGGLERGESMDIQVRNVRVRSGVLGDVVRYSPIVLIDARGNATSYLVRDARRVNDGRETLINLVDG